eukprot:TRINITY_DN5643_c1_g4_i2.p1 TRINITY_DN5643_c1_g4~~TRINITY_DN5643_c1_g4_i2.p1  ORF type:complete len:416 (-),score=71.85 TRINITY_DN5643_c1_g4_i2:295-1542(-)
MLIGEFQIIPNINQYNAKCMGMILEGLTSLGYRDEQILKLVRDRIINDEFEFEMKYFYEIVRFFVRFKYMDEELAIKVAETVEKSLEKLTLDDLADIAKLFSKMDFYDEEFYSKLSARIIDLIQKMEQLSNYHINYKTAQLILTSFVKIQHFDDDLFKYICQHIKLHWEKIQPGRYPPQSLSILYAMSQQQFLDNLLIEKLSKIMFLVEHRSKIWLGIWSMTVLFQFDDLNWWIRMGQIRRKNGLLSEEEAQQLLKVKYILKSAKRMDIYEALQISDQEEKQALNKLKSSQQQIQKTISQVQAEIFDVFTDCGVNCTLEKEIHNGGFSIDFVFQYGGKKYAVEVDGPTHFSRNQPFRKTAGTIVRNYILRGSGWKVIEVPVHEWCVLETVEQKQQYVKDLLRKNVENYAQVPLPY